MLLVDQVVTNLVHYNLWTSVEKHGENLNVLSGVPPARLAEHDSPNQREWVVPRLMEQKHLTLEEIEAWFAQIEGLGSRPKRLTIGLVNDDGTVVYYFVHDGVVKPRQN